MVRAGKARYIGAVSMFAWQFAKLNMWPTPSRTRFVSMQPHYNLIYREEEREMLPLCRDQGIGVIPGARWRAACWPGTGRGAVSTGPPARTRTPSPTILQPTHGF